MAKGLQTKSCPKWQSIILDNSQVWCTVGYRYGSILGPILFAIFINDLEDEIEVTVLVKFTDDIKLGQKIKSREDCEKLQLALNALERWAARWGMSFNTKKCHILHMGRTSVVEPEPDFLARAGAGEKAPALGCSSLA